MLNIFNRQLLSGIKKIQSQIDEDDIYIDKPGYGLEYDPHITVAHGFTEDDIQDYILDRTILKPVKFKIGALSKFDRDGHDVLKLTIYSPDLRELHKHYTEVFDIVSEFSTYSPHITIGYLNKKSVNKYLKLDNELKDESFTENIFCYSDKPPPALSAKVSPNSRQSKNPHCSLAPSLN